MQREVLTAEHSGQQSQLRLLSARCENLTERAAELPWKQQPTAERGTAHALTEPLALRETGSPTVELSLSLPGAEAALERTSLSL